MQSNPREPQIEKRIESRWEAFYRIVSIPLDAEFGSGFSHGFAWEILPEIHFLRRLFPSLVLFHMGIY
jgi:hypothetical protein